MSLTAGVSGFGLGLALITPIGAQNAYVLRTAVRASRRDLLAVVGIVITIDVTLIGLGAAGAGAILDGRDWLRVLLYAVGVALLVPLGLRTLRSAIRGEHDFSDALADPAPGEPADASTAEPAAALGTGRPARGSLRAAVLPALALSLLNPHVYLDTVAIIGPAIATNDPPDRLSFTAGAMGASAVWFVFLALLGSLVLRRYGAPVARAVDFLGGAVMLIVAAVFVVEAITLLTG